MAGVTDGNACVSTAGSSGAGTAGAQAEKITAEMIKATVIFIGRDILFIITIFLL
jgi:hypothetical protein